MMVSGESEIVRIKNDGDWQNRFSNLHIALSLFVLLIAIYSLTYSGTFITDDEHILASRTFSLAFDGHLNDQRVYGNDRVHALSGTTPIFAAQGVNIEPGQALAGAILARLAVVLGVGRVQTIFLLNIWTTALTAVLVFYSVIIRGYPRLTALISALLFGLGTTVWPFTRTYFRDPLAMFFLALAWLCVLSLIQPKNDKSLAWLSWVGIIVGLAFGVLSKNTVMIAAPIILVYILLERHKSGKVNFQINLYNNWKIILIWLGGLLILLILWALFLPSDGVFARFTPGYYLFVMRKFLTTPHPNFIAALAGPLLSPGKSIFIYSPVLLLWVLGLFKRGKSNWASWTYLIFLIIFQALFYDSDWYGHINWGLRFLLPVMPLLVISAAPVVDLWIQTHKGRMGLLTLGLLSLVFQLIGILPPIRQYYLDMFAINPLALESLALWHPKFSPWLWHLNWIFSGGSLDLAAIRVGAQSIPIVIGFLAIICIAVLGIIRIANIWFSGVGVLLSFAITILMLVFYKSDPAFSQARGDLERTQEMISQNNTEGDLVLVKSYGTSAWFYWMNWADSKYPWSSLPFVFPEPSLIEQYDRTDDPTIVLDALSLSILTKIPVSYRRVWLVVPYDSPGANLDIESNWLKAISESKEEWVISADEGNTRLFLFGFDEQVSQ